jgi:hypothetical protein
MLNAIAADSSILLRPGAAAAWATDFVNNLNKQRVRLITWSCLHTLTALLKPF